MKKIDQLNLEEHQALVLWAISCAEHVLQFFEEHRPDDDRPRDALKAGKEWVAGEMSVGEVRKCAFAAHAAARDAKNDAAVMAARAAGHAAATVHVPTHAPHAINYALKAVSATVSECTDAQERIEEEKAWQEAQLPDSLVEIIG